MKKRKVLILSGGHKYIKTNGINVGDVAQLEHALHLIHTKLPGSTPTLLAHSINDCSPLHSLDYSQKLVSYLLKPPYIRVAGYLRIISRATVLLIAARYLGSDTTTKVTSWRSAEVLQEFREAVALIVTGSGTLNDHYLKGPAFVWAIAILCAKAAGIPVILLGQQIGPLRGFLSRNLIGAALRRVDFLGVRDHQSIDIATSIGVAAHKIHYTGDEGQYLPPANEIVAKNALAELRIMQPFIAAHFRRDHNCPFHNQITDFASTLNLLSEKLGAIVVFIPFSYADNDDDREACRLVSAHLTVPNVIFDNGGNAAVTKGVIASAELAIGVANHFCVFAASVGVPTIGLYGTEYMKQKLLGISQVHHHVIACPFSAVLEQIQFLAMIRSAFANTKGDPDRAAVWDVKPSGYYDWLNIVDQA